MKYNIREIEVENPITLAPMAGVCNTAFRTLIKEFGAGLIYAEMVSDKAVVYQNKKTIEMLDVDPTEHPMAMQIFGAEKDVFVEAAKYVEKNCASDIIDINMGCPVPKVTKNEAGAKLLLDDQKIYDIVSAVVAAVDKPVTVKMRIGWDSDNIRAIENAKAIEAAGGSAVAIHGRTAKQMYLGKADWSHIADVRKHVNIPVIGNGDVRSPEDAKRMLDETGCHGVMIGRGALGNPWIIKQTADFLQHGAYEAYIDPIEKLQTALIHMEKLIQLKGERLATLEMRSHMAWYAKGIKGNTTFKNEIQRATSTDRMREIVEEYKQWITKEN